MNSEHQPGRIRQAVPSDLEAVLSLISRVGLPVAGVEDHLRHFVVRESEGCVVRAAGLELYGRHALLRSLAVLSERQGRGEGHDLCAAIPTGPDQWSIAFLRADRL